MSIHVAILRKPYLDAILQGEKSIESRLTRNRQPPFGRIEPGERLFIKQSGGPFRAIARAAAVEQHEDLTPDDIRALQRHYASTVGDAPAYWRSKATSRYAVFITLADVEPIDVGPAYHANGYRAWHVLDERLSPIRETTLTDGAIRNRVVRLPDISKAMRQEPLTLLLPDGREIQTDFSPHGQIRWRGWGPYLRGAGVVAGDRVRLTALGGRLYRVSLHPDPQRPST